MVTIQNRLNQRIIISLNGRRNLDLPAKGSAHIPEEELASPHMQDLITNDYIVVVSTGNVKNEPAKAIGKQETEPEKGPLKPGSAETGLDTEKQAVSKTSDGPEKKAENAEPSKSNTAAARRSTTTKSTDSKK